MPTAPPRHRPPGWRPPDQRKADADRRRGSAAERGYDWSWQKYRLAFLAQHPLCVECLKRGETTAATVVDHIIDHNGDRQLFWDPANHQPLCKPDHDAKTARTAAFHRKSRERVGGSNP